MTSLDRELVKLEVAARDDLVRRWQAAHGCPPATGTRRELLVASAAWQLQARRLGGQSRETRRRLTREMARVMAQMLGATASATTLPTTLTSDGAALREASSRASNGGEAEGSVDCAHLVRDVIFAEPDDAGVNVGSSGSGPVASTRHSRLLRTASSQGSASAPQRTPAPERRSLSPGARLLRDWNGRAHAVDVLAGGYLYEGTTYRSLTAIARQITGAHWSGPRFFGL